MATEPHGFFVLYLYKPPWELYLLGCPGVDTAKTSTGCLQPSACCLPVVFSIGLAHLLLFILIFVCVCVQKTTSVFCREEDACSERCQPGSSLAPAAPLDASAALCNPCSSVFLWICEF